MARTGRIKPANRARRSKSYARNFGDRGALVREMPCCVGASQSHPRSVGCFGDIQAAHAIARGMGGRNGDRRSLVPLCAGHHQQQGNEGVKTFESIYEVDMVALAGDIAIELDDRGID